ncbi:hypothetical protein RRG08_033483 [Elysia crispata]|uniref:Uncharacterized protein n=1 Tax=Elysia crispata TaxID=231223 RepID=A0AAE1E4P1_9GAST|nr:hypothetical protein RRG08_033483 [Elysia crispata]
MRRGGENISGEELSVVVNNAGQSVLRLATRASCLDQSSGISTTVIAELGPYVRTPITVQPWLTEKMTAGDAIIKCEVSLVHRVTRLVYDRGLSHPAHEQDSPHTPQSLTAQKDRRGLSRGIVTLTTVARDKPQCCSHKTADLTQLRQDSIATPLPPTSPGLTIVQREPGSLGDVSQEGSAHVL